MPDLLATLWHLLDYHNETGTMGILDILKRVLPSGTKSKSAKKFPNEMPCEYISALSFNKAFAEILATDKYIARSDYKHLIPEYAETYQFFQTLTASNLLNDFLQKHQVEESEVKHFEDAYRSIEDLKVESCFVRKHNDEYIARHLIEEQGYLDGILKECDPNILLDKEQREVVLGDEDHTLVIAGAGAGKTTTVAAKVRYLVERRKIDPQKILIISFTNKAVNELRERINTSLKIPCPITTFHSVGYAILRKNKADEKRIVSVGYLYNVLNNYLKERVLRNSDLLRKLILFFGSYFSAPYEGDDVNQYFNFIAHADFSTLKSNVHEYVQQFIDRRTRQTQTLNNEIVRSMEEVQIANYLYLHQIDYEYEPVYQYRILDANKPYTPDFRIRQGNKVCYIEHFGITEDGRSNRYSEEELDRYKKRVNDKIMLHRRHHTDLIYTFSQYNDQRSFLEHLQEQLLQRGYVLQERSMESVYKKLVDAEESKYITKLTVLLCNFISNFKTQGYSEKEFEEFKLKTKNVRTKLFLDICQVCYMEYQKSLKESNSIDFQDMINESAEMIRKRQITQEQVDFRYIIVDEYQDISRQRYNLIHELSKLCNAKIMAVGDDWQSIYAFSGSILPLFTQFCQEVGYGQELKITRTYRNAQEVIDIAGNFIQKNSSQIRKELISPKRISNPVIICTYSECVERGEKGGRYKHLGEAVNNAIKDILNYNKVEKKHGPASILLIGRYGFDAKHLCYSRLFNWDEKSGKIYSFSFGAEVKLQFLTAHSSKGLSADNVIIINAKDDIYGFPSKVDDDPVLNLVTSNDQSYNYAEERRLFYVALTRTKNRVFLITPEKRPSEFIKELLSDTKSYPNVTLIGRLQDNSTTPAKAGNRCPICGYPLQIRWNKNYGLKLWICTNDQEICGFMTNDIRGGELSIQKCDWCEDGYLVVKQVSDHFILGCTNYKSDRSGCGRVLNLDHYRRWRNSSFGEEDCSVNKTSYTHAPIPQTAPKMCQPISGAQTGTTVKRDIPINRITYLKYPIGKESFQLMANAENCIITDIELLSKLQVLRSTVAKRYNLSPGNILPNDSLVRLATDKPLTPQEFLDILGIGSIRYDAYGKEFIAAIRQHIQESEKLS